LAGSSDGPAGKGCPLGIIRFFQTLQGTKDIERKIENKYRNRDSAKSEIRKEERGRKRVSKTFPKLDFDSKQF
jgi:cell division protein FtsL